MLCIYELLHKISILPITQLFDVSLQVTSFYTRLRVTVFSTIFVEIVFESLESKCYCKSEISDRYAFQKQFWLELEGAPLLPGHCILRQRSIENIYRYICIWNAPLIGILNFSVHLISSSQLGQSLQRKSVFSPLQLPALFAWLLSNTSLN